MLACCVRNPATEKGTEILLSRREFRCAEMRDVGEKDLGVDLTYQTLKIVGDPSRVFNLVKWMGVIHSFDMWEATDVRDGRKLMVKLMNKDTQNHERSLRQEDAVSAQAVYNLDCSGCPAVVGMFGVFEQFPVRVGFNFFSTRIWYVQDYPGPHTLSEYLTAHYPHQKQPHISSGIASEATIARIMRQVLEGVHEVHQAHVVLRNICATNVNISANGEVVKLHDFWYCVEVPDDDVGKPYESTVWGGYPSCLAPEALLGKYYQAGDIWSCGVIAVELGMGVNPFTAIAVDCLRQGISLPVAQKLRKLVSEAAATLDPYPKHGRPWSIEYLSFLKAMLQPEHKLRPTAAELLEHPFLSSGK